MQWNTAKIAKNARQRDRGGGGGRDGRRNGENVGVCAKIEKKESRERKLDVNILDFTPIVCIFGYVNHKVSNP